MKQFKVEPVFLADTIRLSDPSLFDKPWVKKTGVVKLPALQNPYLNTEVRAYIQHLVRDNHTTADSGQQYLIFLRKLEYIANTPEYMQLHSFTDMPRNDFISDIKPKLTAHGDYSDGSSRNRKFYAILGCYTWLNEQIHPSKGFNFDDDIWTVSEMPKDMNVRLNARNYEHIDFTLIQHSWLRRTFKHVFVERLKTTSLTTALGMIRGLAQLNSYMIDHHLSTLRNFTRDDLEVVLARMHKAYTEGGSFDHYLYSLKSFFETTRALKLPDTPRNQLFLSSDRMKRNDADPHPYSDREMHQILNHIRELPPMMFEAATVIMLQGFRPSDLCMAQIHKPDGASALLQDEDGDWSIWLYMYKVKRWSLFPLQSAAGLILHNRIEQSKEMYGEDCKYIFATDPTHSLQTKGLRDNLEKMVKRNNITGDDGKPLNIRALRRFRQTVASELIRLSDDPELVAIFLGQKGTSSLGHYIKLSATERMKEMQGLHKENDILIRTMGQDVSILKDSVIPDNPAQQKLIPLSNGYCGKHGSDICDHANSCLDCSMFCASKKYLAVYRYQLREAMIAKTSAEIAGYDTIAEYNEHIIERIKNVIITIEKEDV